MGVFDQKPGGTPDEDNKLASTSLSTPTILPTPITAEEAKNQGNDGSIGPNGETSRPIQTDGTLANEGKSDPEKTTDNENFPGQDMGNILNQDLASDTTALSAARSEGTGTGTGLSTFFGDKPEITPEEKASFKRPGKVETPDIIKPVAAYKHREVNHFKIGDFEFRRHILELYSNEAHDLFLKLYQGLTPRDQNAIVEYDFEAAARVEQPVQVTRGSLSTGDIKDPKVIR